MARSEDISIWSQEACTSCPECPNLLQCRGQLPCTYLDVGDPVPIAGNGSSSRLMATVLAYNNGKQTG